MKMVSVCAFRKADTVTSVAAENYSRQQRLDAWKSIAGYLGRTCRTVQRWHAEYGLPIHRLGGDKGSIFAYSDELDDWMRNRGRRLTSDPTEISGPVLLHAALVRDAPAQRHENTGSLLAHGPEKSSSAELVIHAEKMWGCLSDANVGMIVRLFRVAVDLDPFNAVALGGLAKAIVVECLMGKVRPSVAYPVAEAAVQLALEIDPELLEAKCMLGLLKMVIKRDWQGARLALDETLNVFPRTAGVLAARALLSIAERCLQEASGHIQEARMQNALSAPVVELYCWSEYLAGEYASAMEQVEQARASGQFGSVFDAVEALASIQIEAPDAHIQRMEALAADSPDHTVLQGALGYAYAMNGHGRRAGDILDAMTHSCAQEKMCEPYAIALIQLGLNQRQEAVKRLEQSYREGSLWSLGFQSDAILEPLRHDPHFRQFMSKISYPVSESADRSLGFAG
jgi:tetratricopeptide (TPR) repeat protein